jgi:radical SAM superfamily enzyme YgiQ (UPF0313 family)
MKPDQVFWIAPSSSPCNTIPGAIPRHALPRRLILVDLFWTRDKDPRIPLGHASLLAALDTVADLEVRSIIVAVNAIETVADIADKIWQQVGQYPHAQVDVAVGAYIWNEAHLVRLLPLLRARGYTGRIILGGPQISYVESGLEGHYPEADVFIRGQAESSLCELVRKAGRPKIRGVHYAGEADANLQSNAALERLPSPLLGKVIPLDGQEFIRWETQRGCQFKCSFCQHRQAGARETRRAFPMGRIEQEIDLICGMGVKEVCVLDPVFNSNEHPGHAVNVLKRFARNRFAGRLSLQCRAELVDDDFLDALEGLNVCLEFGLQTIHPDEYRAIDRPNSLRKIEAVFSQVRERGISFEVSVIFGLPMQTLASFKRTVHWCLLQQIPIIKAFPLLLLRGTRVEQERNHWNFTVDEGTMPTVIQSGTFSREQWLAMERISKALQETEGRHPSMRALLRHASSVQQDRSRWQPAVPAEGI